MAQNCDCGPLSQSPQLTPTIYAALKGPQSDVAVDCFMWQTFIYLNWPALPGSPGQPDPKGQFGGSAPVVWETFKSYDQVFLPGGGAPPPWGNQATSKALPAALQAKVAKGNVRFLKQTSKVSTDLPKSVVQKLSSDTQVGGGMLVDQAGQTVFYEMLMNQDEFNYITDPQLKLYNADQQYAVAKSQYINLPSGQTQYGSTGAIEVKAAWKVLTSSEINAKPCRFHTAQAVVSGGSAVITVGLVGLHVMQRPAGFYQGFWATFQQVDNCPVFGGSSSGSYSFNNPNCTTCQVNTQTTPPVPTQVQQEVVVPTDVASINRCAQQAIQKANPNSPWQFYQLVNVQWPNSPVKTQQNGQQVPLATGSPNLTKLMNPVLETFLQSKSLSCLGCHQNASAAPSAANANPSFATSYSFLFGHAGPSPSSAAQKN